MNIGLGPSLHHRQTGEVRICLRHSTSAVGKPSCINIHRSNDIRVGPWKCQIFRQMFGLEVSSDGSILICTNFTKKLPRDVSVQMGVSVPDPSCNTLFPCNSIRTSFGNIYMLQVFHFPTPTGSPVIGYHPVPLLPWYIPTHGLL